MDFSENNIFEDRIENLPADKRKPDKETYNRVIELFKANEEVFGSSDQDLSSLGFCKKYKIDMWILVFFFILLTMPLIDNKCSNGILKNCTIRFLVKVFIFILLTFIIGMIF